MNDLVIWFNKLQQREKNMVLAMTALVIITLLYLLIWEPVFKSGELQAERLQNQKKVLSWMRNAETEINAIRSAGQFISPKYASMSINALIERSAISAGIRGSIDKMDSDKNQAIKVQLKSVEFDRLVQWLGKLQTEYGVIPKHVTINKTDKTGLVSCRITLEKISA